MTVPAQITRSRTRTPIPPSAPDRHLAAQYVTTQRGTRFALTDARCTGTGRVPAVRIHTFSADHGRRINLFDSDFLQVPLSQPGDVCMASAMFLPPGGVIRRHEATMPQLLCVIAGSGYVSGSDGVEVPIEALQAAFWEAGESHGTRTDTGMTTITLEGTDLQPFAPLDGTDPGSTSGGQV